MKKTVWFFVLFLLAFPAVSWADETDQFTTVVASSLTPGTKPVLGTDGNYHAVYELILTNTRRRPATLRSIKVLDSNDLSPAIAEFEGDELLALLRRLDNRRPPSPEIEFNGSRLFLIHVAFDSREDIPRDLMHEVKFSVETSDTDPTPIMTSYIGAPFTLSHRRISVLGAPLEGKGWIALDSCCEADALHRNTGMPVNGKIYYVQRFAIDWLQLDEQGRLAHGDLSNVENYTGYGNNVLAVANGTVIQTLDTLDDQIPGSLPDPSTLTPQTLLGNHIILDLHNGLFVFYAHLQKGANGVRVRPGDRVRRGQIIGKVGNSGNTSAPHLHIHLMNGPSPLGSNGLPYVIRRFEVAGQVPPENKPIVDIPDGSSLSDALFPEPLHRHHQLPLDLNIINFDR